MPRKAKENEELKDIKKTKTKKSTSKEQVSTTKKKTSSKKVSTAKKSTATKRNSVASTKKISPSKSSEKVKTKKTSKKSPKATKSLTLKDEVALTEYYDLPQKYNKTVVKLLAQTPKTLFIYWEISDDDIQNYKKQYGENFFETTKPVLIVHNDTLNYSFEVEINDFANSWYLHVDDSKSDYRIELGRRPIKYDEKINSNYIYISSSNEIESPNDHILFNTFNNTVYFKNVKNNSVKEKPFSDFALIKGVRKIYNIYDLYKDLYNQTNIEDLSNPSSNSSSQFK